MKTIAVIQSEQPAFSLPFGIRRVGGFSLRERVVRQLTDCEQIDQVVVLVLEKKGTVRSREHGLPPDVSEFSWQGDPLSGFVAVMEHFQADSVIRVQEHQPFVDPIFIDRLVTTAQEHPECDYVAYGVRKEKQTTPSTIGVFGEWCRRESLCEANLRARQGLDRQWVTRYIFRHPELFQLRFLSAPRELDCSDVRFSIEGEEDWEHLFTLWDALGGEEWDWRKVAGLLRRHPQIRKRMESLNEMFSEKRGA